MNYKRIGKVVFISSLIYELGAYCVSDKKTYTGAKVDPYLFSYNMIVKSIIRGFLWPWHVPLITYDVVYNHGFFPQYKRECAIFIHGEEYLDEGYMLSDKFKKQYRESSM